MYYVAKIYNTVTPDIRTQFSTIEAAQLYQQAMSMEYPDETYVILTEAKL